MEQQYQGSLQSSIITLHRLPNEDRSEWRKAGNQRSKYPGMCHHYLLRLTDTRPAGADVLAVGHLDSGGAYLIRNKAVLQAIEITHSHAMPPPPPLASDTPYLDTDTALQPSRSFSTFDCSPCSDDESDTDVADSISGLRNISSIVVDNESPPMITSPPLGKRQGGAPACTVITTVTPLPTETNAAQANSEMQASNAQAAAAAAAAGELSSLQLCTSDTNVMPFHLKLSRLLGT